MEAWADFFAGQTAGGYNDFSLENGAADPQGVMGYCDGTRDATTGGACWDWNYVEDSTARPNPNAPFEDIGTPLQMRRVATTLFDAFDGHPRGGDDPGQGDFWHLDPTTHLFRWPAPIVATRTTSRSRCRAPRCERSFTTGRTPRGRSAGRSRSNSSSAR